MLELSKFFTNDIVGSDQTLKPLLLIVNSANDSLMYVLTQDTDTITTNEGIKLDTITAISSVSNVKSSIDYDSKKLKMNKLRCKLYNYYDVNTKLSKYINQDLINHHVYLFYKSPTTNVISGFESDDNNSYFRRISSLPYSNTYSDLWNISDYDCAMVYQGEISRIDVNDENIDILAEDKTQIKIAGKQVPYMTAERLPEEIKNNLTNQNKRDDVVVPMTFGKVDKAPTISYYAEDTEREMNVLFDVFPTHTQYKTAKIPYLVNGNVFDNANYNYFLYVKANEDYITLDHNLYTTIRQYEHFSRVVIDSRAFSGNYMFPELLGSEEQGDFGNWGMRGFYQRQCISAYGANGSILDVTQVYSDDQDDTDFDNLSSLTDNNNYAKGVWYRQGETLTPSADNFYTNWRTFTDNTEKGSGRWLILKLEPAPSNTLVNIKYEGEWRGNTFLLADWAMEQSDFEQRNFPVQYERIGFHVAPIPLSIWSQINIDGLVGVAPLNEFLNDILVNTDEQISEETDVIDVYDPYIKTPIFLPVDEQEKNSAGYWGEQSNIGTTAEWNSINGLYYGDKGALDRVTVGSADEHNLLAIFEFHPYFVNPFRWRTALTMNNLALLHSVLVNEVNNEKIYASIEGRKNHLYTEQIDPELYTQNIVTDITLNDLTSGTIDDSLLLDNFYNIISYTFNQTLEDGLDEYFVGFTDGNNITDPEWDTKVDNFFQGSYIAALNESFISAYSGAGSNEYPVIVKSLSMFELIFKAYLKLFNLILRYDILESGVLDGWGFTENIEHHLNNRLKSTANLGQIFKSESFVKSFGKYVYEYLLQRPVNYTPQFRLTFTYPNSGMIDTITSRGMQFDGWHTVTLQLSMELANYLNYGDDYSIGGNVSDIDSFFENFYTYIDDLTESLNLTFNILNNHLNYPVYIEWSEASAAFGNQAWKPANVIYENSSQFDGIGSDNDAISILEQLYTDVTNFAVSLGIGGFIEEGASTTGIIEKPSDIVMNILTNELGYGKYDEEQELGEVIKPHYNKYDMFSIAKSRLIHGSWKMGFSVDKKIEGKKLIEDILSESMSYPHFDNEGKFSLINIKPYYNLNEIDKYIEEKDIIKYKFSETKIEDVFTSCTMFYNYDYGLKKYTKSMTKNIVDLVPAYYNAGALGKRHYNLKDTDGHKDIYLKHHSDRATVERFLNYTLSNNANTHLLINITLPLSYMDLTVGDIIRIPLINNEEIFLAGQGFAGQDDPVDENYDYTRVNNYNSVPYSYKNQMLIYPMWIIMESNIGTSSITLKAYQLHYCNYS